MSHFWEEETYLLQKYYFTCVSVAVYFLSVIDVMLSDDIPTLSHMVFNDS